MLDNKAIADRCPSLDPIVVEFQLDSAAIGFHSAAGPALRLLYGGVPLTIKSEYVTQLGHPVGELYPPHANWRGSWRDGRAGLFRGNHPGNQGGNNCRADKTQREKTGHGISNS